MGAAAARALARAGSPGALRARLLLAGLPVALELDGCPEAWPALLAHAAGERTFDGPPLALRIAAYDGPPPRFDHLAVQRRGEAFRCDGDGLRGELAPGGAELEVHGGEPALLAALRLCAAIWLLPRGGLLLHGACAEAPRAGNAGGVALALLGPSGAGKTTLARRLQAAGARVISDEVTAVRCGSASAGGAAAVVQGARVCGHPFPRRLGDGLAPAGGLPLRALGLLSQAAPGAGPSVRRLPAREAARALLARVFLPVRDRALLGPVLDLAALLLAEVPAFALAVPDDERAAASALRLASRAQPASPADGEA